MTTFIRPTRMEVLLENCRYNYHSINDFAQTNGSRTMCVVKANAYGLGAAPVAWALKSEGADFFGVATADEAMELREAGILDPIIVLGSSPYNAAEIYVKNEIRATVTDMKMAEEMSSAAVKLNRPAFVHLKVDTGMGRIGFLAEAALEAAEKISKLPGVEFEGIFTHFSTSDEPDLTHTKNQYEIFKIILEKIKNAGIKIKMTHCCNSGAILNGLSDMFCDMVRPGHILNGLLSSWDCGTAIDVRPCMEVKSEVGALRELPPNTGVGYGLTHRTEKHTKTAIIPIGYADGYSRALSNSGEMLIGGTRCRILGRVSMDQTVVDVTHLENVRVGDEVVIIGRQGNEFLSIDEIAKKISVIPAVVQLNFNIRVPKIYVESLSATTYVALCASSMRTKRIA